jgi:transglutaminase-like putative cysteine protease
MHINILHETTYAYQNPARAVVQHLRMTPRAFDGQHIANWRIEPNVDGRFVREHDALGNIIHRFFTDVPVQELTLKVTGEVITDIDHGIVRGTVEHAPLPYFLRETPLTQPDMAIRDYAASISAPDPADPLARLHDLLTALHQTMVFDTEPTHAATTAAEAFALQKGVCQDLSHVFISVARLLNIPARYVSGYFRRNDGVTHQEAAHAWVEAYVRDLGWVGFDPTNGICMGNAHVRVAIGLDYLDSAPIRGSRLGGGLETMNVDLHINCSSQQ